jgi:hypothetical protein
MVIAAPPGLETRLLAAGFAAVDGYDQDGPPLSAASRRLLAVAQR